MDSSIIIFAILCLAIGCLVGLLVSSLLGSRSRIEKGAVKPEIDRISLWRERPDGPLRIDLDGKSISNASSLTPDQKQRLAACVSELQAWSVIPPSGARAETGKGEAEPVNILPESKAEETHLKASPKQPKPLAQKSIVSQIDEILQDQVVGTALAGRGIKLCEAPGNDVTVWIGQEQFQGIDAVPDAEVLAAIRLAVKTWEEQVRFL